MTSEAIIRMLEKLLANKDIEIRSAALAGITLIKNQQAIIETHRWIPISEQLPTAADANRFGYITCYSAKLDQTSYTRWHYILDDGVTTHWMSRPEPPKQN
jgi:hypothetical protein